MTCLLVPQLIDIHLPCHILKALRIKLNELLTSWWTHRGYTKGVYAEVSFSAGVCCSMPSSMPGVTGQALKGVTGSDMVEGAVVRFGEEA